MRARSVPALLVSSVLLTGCSLGTSSYNGNRPDPTTGQERGVVRTPSPLGTDLPSTDPPLVNPLPGPTGGLPGVVPTTALPASPGQGTDGGAGAPST